MAVLPPAEPMYCGRNDTGIYCFFSHHEGNLDNTSGNLAIFSTVLA